MRHNQVVRKEFSKQAAKFGEKGYTLSSAELLHWIINSLPLDKEFRVLDVAAGTGHLSLGIAPYTREVVAIDLTPAMLSYAREEISSRNLDNVSLVEGSAETLPHAADGFDLVVSRLAIHHFEEPSVPLREMVRVCKPNHRIGIIDLLSPEDEEIAAVYNHLERLRDPSHTVALSEKQMEEILAGVGLEIEKIETRDVEVDFQRWVQMSETKSETVRVLREQLMKDIQDGSQTGMRPFLETDELKFLQVWSVVIGTKISKA